MNLINDFQKKAIIDIVGADFDIIHFALRPRSKYDADYYIFFRRRGVVQISACTFGENAYRDLPKNEDSYDFMKFVKKFRNNVFVSSRGYDGYGDLDKKVLVEDYPKVVSFIYNTVSSFCRACLEIGVLSEEFAKNKHNKILDLSEEFVSFDRTPLESYYEVLNAIGIVEEELLERVKKHVDFIYNETVI